MLIKKKVKKSEFKGTVCNLLGSLIEKKTVILINIH